MATNTRDIKRRIKSVTNTKQITKAMELVSASKMRRAINSVQASRAYANLAWETVLNLAERTDRNRHPLLRKRMLIKKEAIIVISSNRGLCGGFNQQISRLVSDYINGRKNQNDGLSIDLITHGKRARESALKSGYKIMADFDKTDVISQVAEITSLSRLVIDDFRSEKYDRVLIAFTDFVSSLKQLPRLRQILPIEKQIEEFGVSEKKIKAARDQAEYEFFEYLFEPSPDVVLETMLPKLVEIQIYQAVLESNASEHSARMMAMRNASENAEEYINDLILTFNQARQASITRDLAEISASRAVLTN